MSNTHAAAPAAGVLHFFCGKAGAGKSTIARKIAEGARATLICEDVWLARLYGDQMHTFADYRRMSERLKLVIGPLTVDLLQAGRNVVLDFPANTRSARAWFRSLCEQSGSDHVLHFVDSPDEVCLQRIARRNTEAPEGSHNLTPELFAYITSFFEPPEDGEGLTVSRNASVAARANG
jgi:predicted kinase